MCLIAMPILSTRYSWRWVLVLAAAIGAATLCRATRAISESGRWQRAAASGTTAVSSFYDGFREVYRLRTIAGLVSALLANIAAIAASTWACFHLVWVVLDTGGELQQSLVG
jgi:hypothetical protein